MKEEATHQGRRLSRAHDATRWLENSTEKSARYDSADYLKTPEDVAEYLVAALEDGGDDAAYVAYVIGIAAQAHGGMTKLAKETGMTRAELYETLSRDGNPSFETIVKAMRVLGVRLVPQPAPSRQTQARSTQSGLGWRK